MSKKCRDILIVEDQRFFQGILEIALKDIIPESCFVRKVDSGNKAIELLKAESDSIGLILLDMKMDDGDGITVLNFLESNDLFRTPVYIVSSLDKEFISFVMQSIANLEVRLVGFIPKDTPDVVISRIKGIKNDIQAFLLEEPKNHIVDNSSLPASIDGADIINILQSDLILYVQPKIDIVNSGRISGYEVLSRLCDDDLGIIETNVFLPYIDTFEKKWLFNWLVIEKVFKHQRANSELGFHTNYSINVEPMVLEHADFMGKFEILVNKYEVELSCITLEITEVSQPDTVKLYFNIARLKLLGVKISLDDYGKGYSNIDRIERIPFDEVKIDTYIFAKALESEKEKKFFISMIEYLNEKGCDVVAERVEDKETHEFLTSINTVQAQGYYYSMPKPITEMDYIFTTTFKSRVSSLLGDMGPEGFKDIYSYFYTSTVESIERYLLPGNELTVCDFVHQLKGTLKTAGLYEGVEFIEKYKLTEDLKYILRLKEFLQYFNNTLINRVF